MSTSRITAPVVGFNHNLKHAGRVFHVQTEDSGLPRAHFLTHLYIGGNILASAKGSYADKLDDPELPKLVRKMMEDQHKQMVRRLVAGEFTEVAAKFSPHYEPGVLADGHTGPAAVNVEGASPNDAAAVARLSPASPSPPPPPPAPPIAPPPGAPAAAAKAGPSAPGAPLRMFEERPLPARTHHEQAPSTRMPLITREAESAATTLEEAFAAAAAQLADEGPAPELLHPPVKARPKPPAAPASPANLAAPATSAAPSAVPPKPISGRAPPPTPPRLANSPSILAPPTASHPSPLPAASPSARPLPPAPAQQHAAPAAPHPVPPPAAPASAAAPPSSSGARKLPSAGSVAPGAFAGSAGVTRGPGAGAGGEYRLAGAEVAVSGPGQAKAPPAKLADWELPHDTAPGSSVRRPPPGQGLRPLPKPLRAPTAPDTVPELPKVPSRATSPSPASAPPSTILASPASDPPPTAHLSPPASSPPAPARMPGAPLPSTTRIAASSFRGIPPPLVTPVALVPRFAPQPPRAPPVMQPMAPLPQPAPRNPLVSAFAEDAKPPGAPADILGPDEDMPPLFAEELISERSLDEVILAFLSSGDAEKPK